MCLNFSERATELALVATASQWPLQNTAALKRTAEIWSRVDYATRGAKYHTWFPSALEMVDR